MVRVSVALLMIGDEELCKMEGTSAVIERDESVVCITFCVETKYREFCF